MVSARGEGSSERALATNQQDKQLGAFTCARDEVLPVGNQLFRWRKRFEQQPVAITHGHGTRGKDPDV